MTWAAALFTALLLGSPAGSARSSAPPPAVVHTVVEPSPMVTPTVDPTPPATSVATVLLAPEQSDDLLRVATGFALIGCVGLLLLTVIAVRLLSR